MKSLVTEDSAAANNLALLASGEGLSSLQSNRLVNAKKKKKGKRS